MASNEQDHSPRLIPNPFIKKRNLEWMLDVSPRKKQQLELGEQEEAGISPPQAPSPTDAFADLFARTLDPYPESMPRIAPSVFRHLHTASAGSAAGAHFVIHQHDHPVAGPHYDLRLQINPSSSASFAIMYGLPGDPNSSRRSRAAVETRVHALASHAAEGASRAGGSLLIWDTGTYRILDTADPDSDRDEDEQQQQQERLHAAFARRKIRLSLLGERLPRPYVVYLRLTKAEDAAGRARASGGGRPRRKRKGRTSKGGRAAADNDLGETTSINEANTSGGGHHGEEAIKEDEEEEGEEEEEEEVRRTNAYRGATNSIGSVYQRRWYLSLDASGSGFVRRGAGTRATWERRAGAEVGTSSKDGDGAAPPRLGYPFYVRGPQLERSVVTGRLASDLFRDEGLEPQASRRGWRAVMN